MHADLQNLEVKDMKGEVWAANRVLSSCLGLKVSSPSVCLTGWVGQDKTRVSKLLRKHLKNSSRHISQSLSNSGCDQTLLNTCMHLFCLLFSMVMVHTCHFLQTVHHSCALTLVQNMLLVCYIISKKKNKKKNHWLCKKRKHWHLQALNTQPNSSCFLAKR